MTQEKQRTQFKIWAISYFLAPFSWSKWVDISTFSFGTCSYYLLQGKVNKKSNAKRFRITSIKNKFSVVSEMVGMDVLRKAELLNEKVEYNQ